MVELHSELGKVLAQFNPWWRGVEIPDLPRWRRAAGRELRTWVLSPPARRAVLLSGARQVGKTTLLLQAIHDLLLSGVPASNILYATLDHPILKLAGIESVLDVWRQREPKRDGPEYLFLDEAQFIRDWATWIKHQVDFSAQRRIIFTGSSMPLRTEEQESGVGRWHTIRLTTLTFFEYTEIKQLQLPPLPKLQSLAQVMDMPEELLLDIQVSAQPYVGHFHEYLVRGGFPQTAQIESVTQAQRLLREDIIDKVLKRDMTALFGVRRILDLEHTFLYLCLHDGGLLDMPSLCSNLAVQRPTAQSFIELLEATHLIYRLLPHGYGKEVLRGKAKIYMADAAIASAVLLRGKAVLEDSVALGVAAETAAFKHLFARYYSQQVRFTYWRGKKHHEVDVIAQIGQNLVPFEVKYQTQPTHVRELKGLIEMCRQEKVERGYIVTKGLGDFGPLAGKPADLKTLLFRIPAPLFCYWMGAAEVETSA